MARTYFTLLEKSGGEWFPQFGDYDRETVESERDDYRDHGVKARDLKIVTTKGHGMKAINEVLARLNKLA